MPAATAVSLPISSAETAGGCVASVSKVLNISRSPLRVIARALPELGKWRYKPGVDAALFAFPNRRAKPARRFRFSGGCLRPSFAVDKIDEIADPPREATAVKLQRLWKEPKANEAPNFWNAAADEFSGSIDAHQSMTTNGLG
jgi:hypothetical protein